MTVPNSGTIVPSFGGGGGGEIPDFDALPASAEGTIAHATIGGVPVTALRGVDLWRPSSPTKAQLAARWPASPQTPGISVGPMPVYVTGISRQIPETIVAIGDSNTVGQGATAENIGCRIYSPPKLAADALGWRDGAVCSHNLVVADPRVSPSGWTSAVKEIPGACWVHDTSVDDMTIVLGIPFDKLLVTGVAIPGNPATTTILIDDVVVGSINHDLGSAATYLPTLEVTVARGLHTIKVRSGGSSGTCYVNTLESFDSLSTAPEFVHLGIADANIGDHISSAPYGAQARAKMFCSVGTTAFMGSINDLDDGIPVATIQAGFATLKGMWTRRPGSQFCGIIGWCTDRPGVTAADLDALYSISLSLSQDTLGSSADMREILGRTVAEMDPADIADPWHLTAQGYAKEGIGYQRMFR